MSHRFDILLVEDNPEDVQLMREMITELESDLLNPFIINITHASSLKEALQHKDEDFHAVLLDLTLPDSKGLVTVNTLLEKTKKIPIIVLTGINDARIALESVKYGAQDYLVKNEITGILLLRSIQYAIERLRILNEKEELIRELQDAAVQIRTLSGLLPICASCKNIRNDKGYWERIESYISKHSEAQFTHGICPDCKKKLYPELGE